MVALQRALGAHVTVLFGHEQGKYPDGNTVLVRGATGSVVIDPALSARTVEPPLRVDTVPSVGPVSPQMSFKSVLLPAPLGPTSTTCAPLNRRSSIP